MRGADDDHPGRHEQLSLPKLMSFRFRRRWLLYAAVFAVLLILVAQQLGGTSGGGGAVPPPPPPAESPKRPSLTASSALSVRGADISSALQEKQAGTRYSLDGRRAPLAQLLREAGANYLRLRLWVNPPPIGSGDLTTALALARQAKGNNLKVFLDLHYSDTWADPSQQDTPAAWRGQDLKRLVVTVHNYTMSVLNRFEAQRTHVDMIQLGNEVDLGILWPEGKIYLNGKEDWAGFAALMNAGIAGARDAERIHGGVLVVIHISRGTDVTASRYFFDHLIDAGVTDFDMIGLTYYPFFGSLAQLQATVVNLDPRYRRGILIAETGYPSHVGGAGSYLTSDSQLPDHEKLPATPRGQQDFFARLRTMLQALPGGLGLGLFSWEPGWFSRDNPVVNPFNGTVMFDANGVALPAFSTAFRPPTS